MYRGDREILEETSDKAEDKAECPLTVSFIVPVAICSPSSSPSNWTGDSEK